MMLNTKTAIFISYRRDDTAGYAGRLYDRLSAHFGEDRLFMDVDTLAPGVNFVDVLRNAVASCDVLIALIGHQWLHIADTEGGRKLDNLEDFVRLEIVAALERGITVIPVLVGGARNLRSIDLPDDLKPLANRHAVELRHTRFNADVDYLVLALERELAAAEETRAEAQRLAEEAERKAKEESERKVKEEAEHKSKQDAEKKALYEAEHKEKEEAERKTKEEAECKVKKEAEQKAIEESTRKTKEDAERKEEYERAPKPRKAPYLKPLTRPMSARPPTTKPKIPTRNWIIGSVLFGLIAMLLVGGTGILAAVGLWLQPVDATATVRAGATFTARVGATATARATLASYGMMVSEKDGMILVYVPEGEFLRGSSDSDTQANDGEKPQHTVTLDAFWIDQTEVTNGMYALCVESGDCTLPSRSNSSTRNAYYGNSDYDDFPVIYVSWEQADDYCKWAKRRLPTEAEWEKAARGIDGRLYPWGNTSPNSTLLNYYWNTGDTTAVGSYPDGASPFGALDMVGNIWEWVADWYNSYSDVILSLENPLGPTSGSYRVIRGGFFDYYDRNVSAAKRGLYLPDSTNFDIGFRCARWP